MAKLLEEIHPGEILLEDFMKAMGISARQLASDIDVSPSRNFGPCKLPRPHRSGANMVAPTFELSGDDGAARRLNEELAK